MKLFSIAIFASALAYSTASVGAGGTAPMTPQEVEASVAGAVPPAPVQEKDFADMVEESSLTPAEIKKLKSFMRKSQLAGFGPGVVPPKPEVNMTMVDLSPGATPPLVRLSEQEGCSLVFLDSTGKPWPIQNQVNFAPKLMDVKVPIKDGHILTIEPKIFYGNGNVAVFLRDLPTPITLTVLAGQKNVDYRLDMRIPKVFSSVETTPNGSGIEISPDVPTTDPILSNVLSNTVATSDATSIKSSGDDVKAWIRYRGNRKTLLIRTSGTLLSPAPLAGKKAIASDGSKAYEITVSPVITILRDGKPENIKLEIES